MNTKPVCNVIKNGLIFKHALKHIRRIAGKISNHAMGMFQIKHGKDRILRSAVLPFYDGVAHTGLLNFHIVFKYSLSMQADPAKPASATLTSISGFSCISLYTSFWLLVQNQSFPSFSKQNMNGRHFAFPSFQPLPDTVRDLPVKIQLLSAYCFSPLSSIILRNGHFLWSYYKGGR